MPTFIVNRSVFEQLPVRRVEVRVHPRASAPGPESESGSESRSRRPEDLAAAESHLFEAGGPPPSHDSDNPDPTALAWTPERTADVESYTLHVVFDGERAPYDSPEITVPADAGRSATLPIIDLGVRVFDAHALPDTIRSVEGSFVDLSGQPKSFRLSADVPLYFVFAGIDYRYGEPIDYHLDYQLADGNYRPPKLSSDNFLITVDNPLHPKTVTFEGVGFASSADDSETGAVQLVQLTYSHLEAGVGWQIAGGGGDATLTGSQPRRSFTFDAVDPARALTRYQGITIFADGTQQPIPDTLIPETTIPLGDAPLWWTVEIDPGLVDWHSYPVVVVAIRALNAVGAGTAPAGPAEETAGAGQSNGANKPTGADQPETLVFFWQGVPSRYWSFQVPLGHSGTFAWRALYVQNDGTSSWTTERTETSHQAVLPSRLPPSEASAPAHPRLDGPTRREAR